MPLERIVALRRVHHIRRVNMVRGWQGPGLREDQDLTFGRLVIKPVMGNLDFIYSGWLFGVPPAGWC